MTRPNPSAADVLARMTPPETCSHSSDDHPVWRRLLAYAFTPQPNGRLPFHTVVLGTPKKEGRTLTLAAIGVWAVRWMLGPEALVYLPAAPSMSSRPRTHRLILNAFDVEDAAALPNGATLRVLSPDAAWSEEIGNVSLSLWDDLWLFRGDASRELWERLSPVTTRPQSFRVVSSYAGYPGSSPLLEDLYRQGVDLPPVPEFDDLRGYSGEPVVRAGDGMLFYWDTVHRAPWLTGEQGEAYLAEQKRVLPPSEYLRLHHNQWCSATEEKP